MDKFSASELFEDEYMQNLLQETIEKMETAINRRRNVDEAFGGLKHLLMTELERSCKEIRQNVTNDKPHKKSRKRYWNKDLDELWEQVCEAERQWKRCKSSSKSRLRSIFVETRKDFDKDKLHKLGEQNSRDFWKSIGKLGLQMTVKQNESSKCHQTPEKLKVTWNLFLRSGKLTMKSYLMM